MLQCNSWTQDNPGEGTVVEVGSVNDDNGGGSDGEVIMVMVEGYLYEVGIDII